MERSTSIPPVSIPPARLTSIWKGGEAADFILKYDMKGTLNVNGGMQFRSFLTEDPNSPKYPVRGAVGRGGGGGGGGGGSGGGGGGGSGASGEAAVAAAGDHRLPARLRLRRSPTATALAKWNLNGYQVDFDANNQWGGNIYEQGGRGMISTPGHALLAEPGQPVKRHCHSGGQSDSRFLVPQRRLQPVSW